MKNKTSDRPKTNLELIIRGSEDSLPSDIVFKIFLYQMAFTFLIAVLGTFFFQFPSYTIKILLILLAITFIIAIISNIYFTKKDEIGKIIIYQTKIVIESNTVSEFEIHDIRDLKINFKAQSGNVRLNPIGGIQVASSESNKLFFKHLDKEYNFTFASRKDKDLMIMEFFIGIWRKNGIKVEYRNPKSSSLIY